MSDQVEVLPQQNIPSGGSFVALIKFVHIPGSSLPGVDALNQTLRTLGASFVVDSLGSDPLDQVENVLSFGSAVFSEAYCTVAAIGGATGGEIVSVMTQSLLTLEQTYSIHAPSVSVVTLSRSPASGILAQIGLDPGPGLTTAFSLGALAVIVVVGFIVYQEVRHGL
jgi:hypothetical protein